MQHSRNVMLVLYDLPVETPLERRAAVQFRKKLLQRGYRCFQKSVYTKLIGHASVSNEITQLKKIAPETGNINALVITLSEFRQLHCIRGEEFNMAVFADDFLVV